MMKTGRALLIMIPSKSKKAGFVSLQFKIKTNETRFKLQSNIGIHL